MQKASGKGKTKDERDEERNQGDRRRRDKEAVEGYPEDEKRTCRKSSVEDPCLLRSLGSPDRFIYRPYILMPGYERFRFGRKGENDR